MSEIRRAKVKIHDIQAIEDACKECGLVLVKEKNLIIIKNHGIKTWGNSNITLQPQSDGSYALVGDASKQALEKLSAQLLAEYNISIIKQASKKLGYTVNVKKEHGKIKMKLRTFS